MHEYIFTFGFGQKLKNSLPADSCYTAIKAKDELEARRIMVSEYGNKWAFCYFSPEDAGVDRYNLRYIEFGE